jgi:hypothetical protein
METNKNRTGSEKKPTSPPDRMVRVMLARPGSTVAVLSRIVECPVFTGDAHPITIPGYDNRAQIYYDEQDDFGSLCVPTHPTREEIAS